MGLKSKSPTSDDEAFDALFDQREVERLASDLAASINSLLPDAEAARVERLIARDRADRKQDAFRKLAEMELADGVFVNLADTVIEPTPEWLEKSETVPFTPRQPDGTVRTIRTVRRVCKPITTRMMNAGRLTEDQAGACDWYRDCYEAAGLDGRFKTSNLGGAGGGGNGLSCAPMAMHEREVEARHSYRAARDVFAPQDVAFFEAVVLFDMTVRNASGLIRCKRELAEYKFRAMAQMIARHRELTGETAC